MMRRRRGLGALAGVRRYPREYAKLAVRRVLYPRRLGLVSDPYPVRIATALRHLDVHAVLDVGANIGQYASGLRASGFAGLIVSFEPSSDAFRQLERRAAHDRNWEVINSAVGAHTGLADLHVARNSFSSSLLEMTDAHITSAPGSEPVATETVSVTTVLNVVNDRGLEPRQTMLKIDTQGFEQHVLDGAGALVGELAAISLELSFVALYEEQPLFDDLVPRLRAAGYLMYVLEPGFGDRRTGRMLQCDALFVRADRC